MYTIFVRESRYTTKQKGKNAYEKKLEKMLYVAF